MTEAMKHSMKQKQKHTEMKWLEKGSFYESIGDKTQERTSIEEKTALEMKTQLKITQKQVNTTDKALRETESGKEESFKTNKQKKPTKI